MSEPKHVTYRDAIIGGAALLMIVGAIGLWVIGEAKAAGVPLQTQLDRMELKLNDIERFLRGDR